MRLQPLDQRWKAVAAGWLNEKENWKWIQCGSRSQALSPVFFRNMCRRPENNFHLFYNRYQNQPIGMVALCDMDPVARSASLWFVLGDKQYTGSGYTGRAVNEFLRYGFMELGLTSVYARTVRENPASVKILENNHFNYIGRRRQCYPIDNKLHDDLQYDLLSSEFLDEDSLKYKSVIRLKKRHRMRPPV